MLMEQTLNLQTTSTSASYADKYPSYKTTKDVTLYALWRKESITITYKANGGTGSDVTETVKYDSASGYYKYTLNTNTFTRTGWTFAGWGTTSETVSAYSLKSEGANQTTSSDNAVTYYAQWKPSSFTIVYNANGGSGASSSQTVANSASYAWYYNVSISVPSTKPTLSGYTFLGWASSYYKDTISDKSKSYSSAKSYVEFKSGETGTYEWESDEETSTTITLYAVWTPNITITFDSGNDGKVSHSSKTQTISPGVATKLDANTFTGGTFKSWTFLGWSKTKLDSEKTNTSALCDYLDGATVTFTTDTTLYAVWNNE